MHCTKMPCWHKNWGEREKAVYLACLTVCGWLLMGGEMMVLVTRILNFGSWRRVLTKNRARTSAVEIQCFIQSCQCQSSIVVVELHA